MVNHDEFEDVFGQHMDDPESPEVKEYGFSRNSTYSIDSESGNIIIKSPEKPYIYQEGTYHYTRTKPPCANGCVYQEGTLKEGLPHPGTHDEYYLDPNVVRDNPKWRHDHEWRYVNPRPRQYMTQDWYLKFERRDAPGNSIKNYYGKKKYYRWFSPEQEKEFDEEHGGPFEKWTTDISKAATGNWVDARIWDPVSASYDWYESDPSNCVTFFEEEKDWKFWSEPCPPSGSLVERTWGGKKGEYGLCLEINTPTFGWLKLPFTPRGRVWDHMKPKQVYVPHPVIHTGRQVCGHCTDKGNIKTTQLDHCEGILIDGLPVKRKAERLVEKPGWIYKTERWLIT